MLHLFTKHLDDLREAKLLRDEVDFVLQGAAGMRLLAHREHEHEHLVVLHYLHE